VAQFYVYILASRPGGALYIGVTSDLVGRVYEHKNSVIDSHTKRYQIHRLVYFEVYSSILDALQREKNIKHWPRAWKTRLQRITRRGAISMMKSPHDFF
jgi:putative endonuclease